MGVKLHKKSAIINNISIFIVLSVLFLHTVISLGKGVSAFVLTDFLNLLRHSPVTLIIGALTLICIRRASVVSRYFLPLYSFLILYSCFQVFFVNFDKLILVLNLSYLVFSFYFYGLWKVELAEAVYCPGFYLEDVGRKSFYDVRVKLTFPDEQEGWGVLTQVGGTSCFLLVEEHLRNSRGKLKIVLEYEGTFFEQFGEIITSYGGGLGVKFLHNTERNRQAHSWNDFYTVICHRGLLPQYFEGLT